MNFQRTKILLLIVFLLGACEQISSAQTKKSDACEEEFLLYKEYFEEKDVEKRYQKAKAFLEFSSKFSDEERSRCLEDYGVVSSRQKFINRRELLKINTKCVEADKAYFTKPDFPNLNSIINACDIWIEKAPTPDVYYTARLANATGFGLLADFYKDTDRTFSYAEKALERLVIPATPNEWKEQDWLKFRRDHIGRLLQYQGLCKLRQPKPDAEAAVVFLTKAAEIRNGTAYKDTNTYLLRAEANMMICPAIKEALEVKNKRIQPNEKPLKAVCPVAEKVVQDYARVVALSTILPIQKIQNDDSYQVFQQLYNLTYGNISRKKLTALIGFYKQDFRKK